MSELISYRVTLVALSFPLWDMKGLFVRVVQFILHPFSRFNRFTHCLLIYPRNDGVLVVDVHNHKRLKCVYVLPDPRYLGFIYPSAKEAAFVNLSTYFLPTKDYKPANPLTLYKYNCLTPVKRALYIPDKIKTVSQLLEYLE